MVTVVLPAGLRKLAGGRDRLEVEAANVRQLYRVLAEEYPALAEALGEGMAVSIDGEIIPEPLLERLPPDSEVHFLPQIGGG